MIGDNRLSCVMRSGIPEEEAIALIVNGFVKEVIQELPTEFAVEAQKLIGISLEGERGVMKIDKETRAEIDKLRRRYNDLGESIDDFVSAMARGSTTSDSILSQELTRARMEMATIARRLKGCRAMADDAVKPVINIADVPLRDAGNGAGFKAKVGSFGAMIGSDGIGCMLHVVEPGEKAFPFHVHHQKHELFIVLEGEGTYRFGKDRYPIRAGDVCAAPTGGPDKAHQIINTGTAVLKYLGLSTAAGTEVVEYPDSGKFGIISRFDWSNPDAGGIRYIGRTDTSLDYYDGES